MWNESWKVRERILKNKRSNLLKDRQLLMLDTIRIDGNTDLGWISAGKVNGYRTSNRLAV